MTAEHELTRLLARHAFRRGRFVLASGRTSDFYLDAKQVTHRAVGALLVGRAIHRIVSAEGVEAVGGLTMGADAIVTSTVVASSLAETPVDGFVVRKEPKEHGLARWIEGVNPDGRRVAIVDDVVTSGGSLLRAAELARKAGGQVEMAVALVDREEGGRAAIERAGIPFHAVCTLARIRELADSESGRPEG